MPGLLPRFQPCFPSEFVERAQELVRRQKVPRRLWQRAKLVLLLHEDAKLSNCAAAREVGLSDQWVRKWRRRWDGGDFSLDDLPRSGRPARFPPTEHSQIKAVACEAVAETGVPLSRQSTQDITRRVRIILGKPISPSTVWRILDEAAIKPWRYRYWIFPRDPYFAVKATRILDLYGRIWNGERLGEDDYVLSSDEKTSIQARLRIHPGLPPSAGCPARTEFEYRRGGALQYLAAWDVFRGLVFGRTEAHTGAAPFFRLVDQVMSQEPYRSANRVFWVVDNGSSHRGEAAQHRLQQRFPNAILVHTPVHASWLNQVEIYFSIIQRKVLTPNDAKSLNDLADKLRRFEELNNQDPRPFDWRFDRCKLEQFLRRLEARGFSSVPTRLATAA